MNGKVEIIGYEDKDEFLVTVHDYETGSSTSFGADNREEAFERTLAWLGYAIFV